MDFLRRLDPVLLFSTLILVGLGIVMVYSASFAIAQQRVGDPYHFLKKQALVAVLGMGLMFFAARMDYHRWQTLAPFLLTGSILLLVLLLLPWFRREIGGSSRWIRFASLSFQPSELAKLALVVYLARSLTKKDGRMGSFTAGFLPHIVVAGILSILVLKQPDFGTAVLFMTLVFIMLFVAGTPLKYLGGALLAAIPPLTILLIHWDYRWDRILAFLNPWKDQGKGGFQIIQSFVAFGSGKIFGVGLGEGRQKLFYLPEVHTDFIFSIIGEELGLVGVTIVIVLFFLLILRGFQACFRAPDLFGLYLSLGLTVLISVQTLLNMGVVTGLLPTKGSTLPFVSYGGSSLLAAVGILLNVYSKGKRSNHENYNRGRWNRRTPFPGPRPG